MEIDLFANLPAVTTIDTPIPAGCFDHPGHRLVVSVLLHDTRDFYFVVPKHAPRDRDWLIPLQGKAKRDKDHTLGDTGRREVEQEVGVSPDNITFHPRELARYKNLTPARHGQPSLTKYIIVFGAYVEADTVFQPRKTEVLEVVRVSPDELLDCLPACRPTKFRGALAACAAAANLGLLQEERRGLLAIF